MAWDLLLGIGWLQFNRLRLACGLARPRDGWRRAAGIVLRGEEASFVLSSFGLRGDKQTVLQSLHRTLQQARICHGRLIRNKFEDSRRPHARAIYSTRDDIWHSAPIRFLSPDIWDGNLHGLEDIGNDVAGPPTYKFVLRDSGRGEVDLWAQVNHVMLDGVPAQEILNQVDQELGKHPVEFPTHQEFAHCTRLRPVRGRESFGELQTFIDLRPLNQWRRKQMEITGEDMTLTAAILWWLSRHAPWKNLHIGTTVDVPAPEHALLDVQPKNENSVGSYSIGRGVGMLVIRPGDYADHRKGLSNYVKAFNHELELIRRRKNSSARLLDAASTIPARLEKALLHKALATPSAFGAMGLTMLRDASVFGAPISEAGHDFGFIAVGNLALPTINGGQVASFCVKGKLGIVDNYANLLQNALHDAVQNTLGGSGG